MGAANYFRSYIPQYARLARSSVLNVRDTEFVEAARLPGDARFGGDRRDIGAIARNAGLGALVENVRFRVIAGRYGRGFGHGVKFRPV